MEKSVLFTMWMMVLKARQEHAENVQSLVKIQVRKSLHGSVDTPKLAQFFKSKLHVVLTYVESTFRYPPHQETDQNTGLLHPEAQTATWQSCNTMIQTTLQSVMN